MTDKNNIKWSNNVINKNIEIKLFRIIVERGNYGKIDLTKIDEIIKIFNNKYKTKLSPGLIKSLRSNFLLNKSIMRHHKLKERGKEISKEYFSGVDILTLSKKYDFPPINLLREILKYSDYLNIEPLVAMKEPDKYLNKHDREQLNIALANDITVTFDNEDQKRRSLEFEKMVEQILIDNNVLYKTQEQLVEEQTIESGKPYATPDFLILDDNFYINNKLINWIEVKNFYGFYSKNKYDFMLRHIKKQIKRYSNFGFGCIVFRYGFSNDFFIHNAMILSLD